MKLLVIHDKPRGEMGGMKDFIAAQNALLRGAGVQVTEVICANEAQAGSIHLVPSGRRAGIAAARELRSLVDAHKPDAVIAHSVYFALGPQALQALQDMAPSIYVLHDVTPLCPRMTRLTREGTICTRAQGVACVSTACYRVGEAGRMMSDMWGLAMRNWQTHAAQKVRQWVVPSQYLGGLLATHGIRGERIAVVPHFVDAARRDALLAGTTEAQPGRILYAGRLVEEKGIMQLLDALALLRHLNWNLHLSGEGPQRAALEARVVERGWQDRVKFSGALGTAALAQAYSEAQIVVMPSLIPESFGLVGLEAMLSARPVVGFASGGMREWLRDGVSGRIVEWGSSQALAQAIDALFADPHRARLLGEQGRELALRDFSADAHRTAFLGVLERSIANFAARKPGSTSTRAPLAQTENRP